jgi:PD-(D/E)XK nuclease superfamily
MESIQLLQLSQAHLQTLEICLRKFQYLFLEPVALPRIESDSVQQQLGHQFHRLMQQHALGLDIQPMLVDNPLLQDWFQQFQQCPPPIVSGTHHSEHQRTLIFEGIALTAVYDLLIQNAAQAQILDWKTYRRPINPQQIQNSWQTRLYLFILTETSDYRPEQLSMTYWFAQANEDHTLDIPYSATLHQQTRADLLALLSPLQKWLESPQVPLPQTDFAAGHCISLNHRCPFVFPCNRVDPLARPTLINLDKIAELSLDAMP